MHRCIVAEFAMPADPAYKPKDVTSSNVSTLTTYELRQELELRGALDLPEGGINHRAMMQRLVQELVKVESKLEQEKVNSDAARLHEEREAEKRLREQRKAEALERSRQRQADPNYFKSRADLNKEGKEVLEAKKSEPVTPLDQEEEEEAEAQGVDDPFRATKKGRAKVHVR